MPAHEISVLITSASSDGSDEPAHIGVQEDSDQNNDFQLPVYVSMDLKMRLFRICDWFNILCADLYAPFLYSIPINVNCTNSARLLAQV